MNQEFAYNILDILQTMWDAAKQMEISYVAKEMDTFSALSMDLWDSLTAVQTVIRQEAAENKRIRLADACVCAMESLKDIKMLAVTKPEKVEWKLAYELEPIIETAAMQFYYWGIVREHPEKESEFKEFLENTEAFELLKDRRGHTYQCDLVIMVLAYNHLDYTTECVKSVLKNLPTGIKTEILLYNHGSSDDTKVFFESIDNANVINTAVNGALPGVTNKSLARGKYFIMVSNDVIIGKNALENLYRCAEEHVDYGYLVPTTPAVSNLQTIPADYKDWDEFERFTERNNIYAPQRHEQRVRLCNPLCLMPSLVSEEMALDMYQEKFCCENQAYSFPDDQNSFWMRRHGYKNILLKDAYCHHFGSVTLRGDYDTQQKLQTVYKEGRKKFQKRHGFDPWGTGFCEEPELFKAWKISIKNNISILGLNCGIGANSLKVKEILREKGAQGITLYNGTQEECFLQDLQGVSDYAFLFSEVGDIISQTDKKDFYYVVVDDPLQGVKQKDLMQKIQDAGIEFHELAYKKADGQWVVWRIR